MLPVISLLKCSYPTALSQFLSLGQITYQYIIGAASCSMRYIYGHVPVMGFCNCSDVANVYINIDIIELIQGDRNTIYCKGTILE